jgi:thioredoxin reductase (NADPH)
MNPPFVQLAIIGAGPAGLAAAAEARRLDCDSILVIDEAGRAGGTIRQAHAVRNVPFLPDRASGELVASEFERFQARIEVDVIAARIEALNEHEEHVRIDAHDGRVWFARAAVVATGTRPRYPQVPGLPSGPSPPWSGSAQEAVSDSIPRSAAVVGGGDVAFDQACWLRARGVDVSLLCRSDSPRAPAWLQRTAADAGVRVLAGCRVVQGAVEHGRTTLRLDHAGQPRTIEVDRVVTAIGRIPRTLQGTPQREARMWKVVGDATGRRARHVVAAMGDGCLAAFMLLTEPSDGRQE